MTINSFPIATTDASSFLSDAQAAQAGAEAAASSVKDAYFTSHGAAGAGGSGGVACMVDSLTNGAAGSSFRPHLAKILRGGRAPGSVGYSSIYYSPVNPSEVVVSNTSGFVGNSLSDANFGAKSLDGKGYYRLGGTGSASDTMQLTPATAWKKLRIFFLKSVSATSFDVRVAGEHVNFARTVDCSAASDTVGYYDIELPAPTGGVIVFTAPVGDVFIQGVRLLINDDDVFVSDLGSGGRALHNYAQQDSTLMAQWLAAIGFGALLLDGGMNDRTTVSAADHKTDLETVVGWWQSALPDAALFIVQSNEPDDAATTNFLDYVPIKKQVASERGIGYIDMRDVFGDYDTAVSRGLIDDGTHPNATADALRAIYYDKFLRPVLLGRSGAAVPTDVQTSVSLPVVYDTAASGSVEKELYVIGLGGVAEYAMVELDIRLKLATGAAFKRDLVTITLAGVGKAGSAVLTRTPNAVTLYDVASGGAATIDYALAVNTVGERAQITVTPTDNAIIHVTGSVLRMSGTSGGALVYL